nr:retrovirus-related Pol polyprotein from transposon TNT 1-94 [Tanacetum cinerariifolium]
MKTYHLLKTLANPVEDEGFEPPQEEVVPVRRSERTHRAPDHLCLNVEVEEHKMQSIKDNQVWRLVDLPPNVKTVGNKWIFKKKTDMDGKVHTYKARLIAKGFTQTYRVDYEETFSPVANIRVIRILIAIAAFYDYDIWQMNVQNAFLNGYLDEDIYMVQPEDMFLVYGGNPKAELQVDCYCDAGFETDRDDIKSQTGYTFILNDGVVDWKSSKQSTNAIFATKAEYIADSEAAMEVVWIRKFISGLGIVPTINEPIKMFCDNSTTLLISNELGVQKGVKHDHRRYHYVRECIELGEINLLKVPTDNNLAYPFMKALPKRKFTQHARSI